MEAKMLHSAVSSKPMTKHRDGERSAVRTLDKTSVGVLFFCCWRTKKNNGKTAVQSLACVGCVGLGFFFVVVPFFLLVGLFFVGDLGFLGGEGEGNTKSGHL